VVALAVAASVFATLASGSAVQAGTTKCSLVRALGLERQARSRAESEDTRALTASLAYRRAAGEIVRCALSPNPPAPPWKLYAAAQVDEQQSLRADLANGVLSANPNAITYRTGQIHRFEIAVYHDPGAPRSAKVAALEEWDAWCLITTPQYARAYRRNYCHQLIDRIGRTKDYLQEFVTFADGFHAPVVRLHD
jgi:hypothetical protein